MPNPENSANELIFELPASINGASTDLICNFLPQTFEENYFNLLIAKENNNIPCTLSGSTLILKNINVIIINLGSDDFLRIGIYFLNNADLSTSGHSYIMTFIDSSSGTGIVLTTGSISAPLRISPPPINAQFDNITVENTMLFVATNYTFDITTVNNDNIHINAQSIIGILILFPIEYMAIWDAINRPTKIYITLGTESFEDSPEMINGTLITRFNVTSEVSFSEIHITFEFRNPKVALNCDILPVFTVSILDFKLNSILAETLSNNI